MAWERGYYYRVRKVNGRVVREYFGAGQVAWLVAHIDSLERDRRHSETIERRQVKNDLRAFDADLKVIDDRSGAVARAALVAAGFHQHRRGEWRKRRD